MCLGQICGSFTLIWQNSLLSSLSLSQNQKKKKKKPFLFGIMIKDSSNIWFLLLVMIFYSFLKFAIEYGCTDIDILAYLGSEYSCVLFQVMPCLHWRIHWKLRLLSSQIGTQIKLTLALGPMFSVTVIIMLLVCKIPFNVPFPFLIHIMLGDAVANKSEFSWFVQGYIFYSCRSSFCSGLCLYVLFLCRTLSSMGFTGTLSPKIGNLKSLSAL